jgi:hypothetical protein
MDNISNNLSFEVFETGLQLPPKNKSFAMSFGHEDNE